MTAPVVARAPAPWLVAVALGIVYVVWGSTYLAIRVMVEDLPPMASASWRYLVAAVLLAAFLAVRSGIGRLRVARRELIGCAALGLLLPALGNGLVSVGEHQGAPSGIAALLIAAVPLWVIVYRRLSGDRPSRRTTFGVLTGFAGLVLLITSQGIGGDVAIGACLVIMCASVFWSFGSWATPRLPLPKDAFVLTVYEMLFGSVWLLAFAAVRGEHLLPVVGAARCLDRLGLPRHLRVGRRLHGVRVGAQRRADLARRHLRLREPGRGRVPRLADPVGVGDAGRS